MLDILCRFGCGDGLGAHREERTKKQDRGAEQLRIRKALAENPCGKCQRTGGTKELQSLRKRDTNLSDCDII